MCRHERERQDNERRQRDTAAVEKKERQAVEAADRREDFERAAKPARAKEPTGGKRPREEFERVAREPEKTKPRKGFLTSVFAKIARTFGSDDRTDRCHGHSVRREYSHHFCVCLSDYGARIPTHGGRTVGLARRSIRCARCSTTSRRPRSASSSRRARMRSRSPTMSARPWRI